MVYSHEDSNKMGSSTNKLNNEKNKIAMSVVVESIQIIGSSATTLLLTFLGFKGKFRFDKFDTKLENLEMKNQEEYEQIQRTIAYVNSRDSLSHALAKVCNSSISYTVGDNDLNTFKTMFTNSIIKLGTSTVRTGFKHLNKDIFHGYMVVGGTEIKKSYAELDDVFTALVDNHIQEASEVYYTGILALINDDVFNDKYDRFVDATISFLRTELMIITKHWWSYKAMSDPIIEKEAKK
jgi:hypothetical protein